VKYIFDVSGPTKIIKQTIKPRSSMTCRLESSALSRKGLIAEGAFSVA
jgi:hypothetical protein